MANTPPNATLIARVPGRVYAGGLNDAQEYWWDPNPAVRAVVRFLIIGSANFSAYQRPQTLLVDRWCLSYGTPPFTEVQVYPGTIATTVVQKQVNNVSVCTIKCTIGLTATATPVRNGRADITATATGAVGAVQFSLDNFQTAGVLPLAGPGNPTVLFAQLPTGTYTVTVKETRALGCSASQTLTFIAVYGPRYNLSFVDLDNLACQLQIFEREYVGPITQLTAANSPVKLDWSGGAVDHVYTHLIKGSSAELGLYVTAAEPLNALFSGDERLHRIDVSRAGSLLWRGFLLPEQYDVMHLAGTSGITLTASDGLGTLSTVPFTGPKNQHLLGDWTLIQVVQFCLAKLNCDLPLDVLFNVFPARSTTLLPAVEQIKVDITAYQDDKGTAWDCGRVLAELLLPFQARLYQQNGTWRLERIVELTTGLLAPVRYAPGTYANSTSPAPAALLTTIGKAGVRPYWQGGGQRQSLRGAVARVVVTNAPGKPVNLLRFALPINADLPASYPLAWSGSANGYVGQFSQLVYTGAGKPPILRLNGAASPPPWYVFPDAATAQAAYTVAAYVQTPAVRQTPLSGAGIAGHETESITFRCSFTPYGNTPQTPASGLQNSLFVMALHGGVNWLASTGPAGTALVATDDATNPIFCVIPITGTAAVDISFTGFRSAQLGPQPVYARIYAPVGGVSACTIDITNLSLTYEALQLPSAAPYTTSYVGDTRQLVSRADTGTSLFHTDTPAGRYDGTLLDAQGIPALQWGTPDQPGQYREMGDYLTAQRLAWQLAPAQTLSGLLRGAALGVGSLITDPQEQFQGVYLLTAAAYDVAEASWQVAGVQLLPLTPDTQTAPATAIVYEDLLTYWADEAGTLLTYDA